MLKIVAVESSREAVTLRLEGRVIGPWVGELRRSCDRVLAQGRRLTLDLGGVSFIDRDGTSLFRALTAPHVDFVTCSPFVAEQLGRPSPC